MTKLINNISNANECSFFDNPVPYVPGLNILDIWIKFTSYLKPEEVLLLKQIKNKNTKSISQNELDEYSKIKEQLRVAELFKKYKNSECNNKEQEFIYNLMMHTSLDLFMQSRLTEEELNLSYRFLSDLETSGNLEDYIKLKQQESYEKLSIYESYVLFKAKETFRTSEHNDFVKESEVLQKQLNTREVNKNIKLY